MSKAKSFSDFRPSFLGFVFGSLRGLAERAYKIAAPEIGKLIEADSGPTAYSFDGKVEDQRPGKLGFYHGHLPIEGGQFDTDLSHTCPFRLLVKFKDEAISSIELEIFLLNPRFILDEKHFIPANVDADFNFKPLLDAVAPIGLAVLVDPDASDDAGRFALLTADMPKVTAPTGYRDLVPDTLLSRLDLRMKWEGGRPGQIQRDLFGRVVGVPDIGVPKGVVGLDLRLFSPELPDIFNGLLKSGGGFGLLLTSRDEQGNPASPTFIVGAPPKEAPAEEVEKWTLLRQAKVEFGLKDNFSGLILPGLEVHWLGEDRKGHRADYSGGIGLTAVTMDGKWNTSFHARVRPTTTEGYLRKLSELELRATIIDGAPTTLSLTGVFRPMEPPFAWLSDRRLRLSMHFIEFRGNADQTSTQYAIDAAIEGDGSRVLAKIVPETDNERLVAAGLVLAPIVLAHGAIDLGGKGVPPGYDKRLYFTNVSTTETLTAAALGGVLGWFFKNTVKIRELRVVGARIQVQPASLNGGTSASGYESALLLDYDADFTVEVPEANLKTTRTVTTRIDGSGIAFGGDAPPRWVQVPAGVRELALADPGLWELGALGKILRVAEFTLRREPRRELRIRLRLDGNFGIATAGDFILSADLEDDDGLRLEAFPSELSFQIPGALSAKGILHIDKKGGSENISGSLDVTIVPLGLRAYAGARVEKAEDPSGISANALLASLKVQFQQAIPLASSGIGLKGFEGLYAAHFERQRAKPSPSVPEPLQWLENVKGEVATSILNKNAWVVAYDKWAFGLGVELELLASGKLLNLNSMLMLELPGPVITLFAKARILEPPKSNQDAAKEGDLKTGILGVVQYDSTKNEILFAALAEARFQDYVRLRAPLGLWSKTDRLTEWIAYLGKPDERATGTLELDKVASLGVSGYLMAAGHQLTNLPGPSRTLPGFAIAIGTAAFVKIGGGSLYLRVDIENYLALSIGTAVYADGGIRASGELRLFIVSIGVGAQFWFTYQRSLTGLDPKLYLRGEICGSAKVVFIRVSGCVRLEIGSPFTDETEFPVLVSGLDVMSGTNVALHGQGALGAIDAVVTAVGEIDGPLPPVVDVALDAVLSLSLASAPQIGSGASGFAGVVTKPRERDTRFSVGTRSGHYVLKDVLLRHHTETGAWKDTDYDKAPATWWANTQSAAGGQAIPRQLALLTRDPLSIKNAVVSEDDLDRWVDAIVEGVCADVVPAQHCVYFWTVPDLADGSRSKWSLPGRFGSQETEEKIGTLSATPTEVTVPARPDAGSGNDRFPWLPMVPGGCHAGRDAATGNAVPYLRLLSRRIFTADGSIHVIALKAKLAAEISGRAPLELLIATDIAIERMQSQVQIRLVTKNQQTIYCALADGIRLLSDDGVLQEFHQGSENWIEQSEGFYRLRNEPEFLHQTFYRARLDLGEVVQDDHVVSAEIVFEGNYELDFELCIGAIKFIPQAEVLRAEEDEKHKSATRVELETFLNPPEIPLLEQSAQYELEVRWESVGDNAGIRSKTYAFRTTEHPPISALPHLLTQYPSPGEKFHYWGDAPGFGLASPDLFRMLAKFPEARLRIRITDDAGNKVSNIGGTIDWTLGKIFDPASFLDPLKSPEGIHKEPIASLPSALQDAILKSIASGSLACLGNISLPAGGIWIGFDALLRPLAGYSIELSVVMADGSAWPYPTGQTQVTGDGSLLSWRFSTGLHADLSGFAAELKDCVVQNRVLAEAPVFPSSEKEAEPAGIRVISDDDIEQALFSAGRDRLQPGKTPTIVVHWVKTQPLQGGSAELVPHSIVVVSPEPIFRKTDAAVITRREVDGRTIRIAERTALPFQEIDIGKSKGVTSIVQSSSGFMLVAVLAGELTDGFELAIAQNSVDRVVRPVAPVQSIVIEAHRLSSRPSRSA